jgi:hypothetical protein
MSAVHRFRMAMAKHMGKPLTPEVAAAIEAEAFAEPDRSIDPARFAPSVCGSLTFQVERLSAIEDEMEVLHQAHYAETEGHRHSLRLAIDYEALRWEERQGTLIQFTARRSTELVGNFRLYLRVSRHTQTPLAIEDTLFLMPHVRRGRASLAFVDYAGEVLRSLGYHEFRATVKKTNPAAGRLLEHRGFLPVATEYVLIDKEQHDVPRRT